MELKESRDFKRVVTIKKDGIKAELPLKTLLLTAISKPKRLLEFLPKNVQLLAFEDHHSFTKDEIDDILEKYKDFSIVTTQKDFVKLESLGLKNVYLMDLDIEFSSNLDLGELQTYINSFKN